MYMFRVSVPNKMWEMHYWQNCRHTLYRKSHVKTLSYNSNIRYFKAICTAQIHSSYLKCCTCTCKLYPCNVLTTKLIYHVCWSVKGFIVVQQEWYQYIPVNVIQYMQLILGSQKSKTETLFTLIRFDVYVLFVW